MLRKKPTRLVGRKKLTHGDITVILTSESVDKILGVTIQKKPRQQYFHMVLFILKFFTK